MKLIGTQLLDEFIKKHNDARSSIESWRAEVLGAQWKTPHDLKNRYPKASLLKDQQAVFNICGNKYRLLAQTSYKNGIVLVSKIGTHKDYNHWSLSK